MKIRLALLILIFATLSFLKSFADAPEASIDKGKSIFTTRCTSCHNVNAKMVGPALANVDQRHSFDWIVNFVHSPKTLIEKNDKDAVGLYNQFSQIMMPDHQDLSSDDIKNVVAYIKSETKTSATSEAPFAKPGKIVPNYHPLTIKNNYGFFLLYLFIVAVFVMLMIVAVNIKELQRKK